jgi:hypothetical protein
VNRLKTGSGNALARGCGVLFGLLFMLPSLPILIAAAAGLLRDPENNLITAAVAAVCAAPFFLIGAGIVVASLVPWIAGMRVGRPEVTVSNSSLRVGDGFSVAYAQTFKRRAEVRGVGVALVQRERATYTSGSSSTTVSHGRVMDGVRAAPRGRIETIAVPEKRDAPAIPMRKRRRSLPFFRSPGKKEPRIGNGERFFRMELEGLAV